MTEKYTINTTTKRKVQEKIKGILERLREDAEQLAGWLGSPNRQSVPQPIPIPAQDRVLRRPRR